MLGTIVCKVYTIIHEFDLDMHSHLYGRSKYRHIVATQIQFKNTSERWHGAVGTRIPGKS
jgi:hypothetical protein